MFFSFLVPNTSTTISRTISQCQTEKVPMVKLQCVGQRPNDALDSSARRPFTARANIHCP